MRWQNPRRPHAIFFCYRHVCGVCYGPLKEDDTAVKYPHCACRAHAGCFAVHPYCIRHQCAVCQLALMIAQRVNLSCSTTIHTQCVPKMKYPVCGTQCPYCLFHLEATDFQKGWPNNSTIAKWLPWLYQNRAAMLIDKDAHRDDLIQRGITVKDLVAAGYGLDDLRAQYISWTDLHQMGFKPEHMLVYPFDQFDRLMKTATGLWISDTDNHLPTPEKFVEWNVTPLFLMQNGVSIKRIGLLQFTYTHFVESHVTAQDILTQDADAADWAGVGITQTILENQWNFGPTEFIQLKNNHKGWEKVNTAARVFDPWTPKQQGLLVGRKQHVAATSDVYTTAKSD